LVTFGVVNSVSGEMDFGFTVYGSTDTLGIDDQNARFISGILPAVQSRNTRFPGCVQRVR